MLRKVSICARWVAHALLICLVMSGQGQAQSAPPPEEEETLDSRLVTLSRLQRQLTEQRERIRTIETQLLSLRRLPDLFDRAEREFSARQTKFLSISLAATQADLAALLEFLKKVKPSDEHAYTNADSFVRRPEQQRAREAVSSILSLWNVSIDSAIRLRRSSESIFLGIRFDEPLLESQEFSDLPDTLKRPISEAYSAAKKEVPAQSFENETACRNVLNNVGPGDPDITGKLADNVQWLDRCMKWIPAAHAEAAKRVPLIGNALRTIRDETSRFQESLRTSKSAAEGEVQKIQATLEAVERKSVQQRLGKTLIDTSAQTVIYYTLWAWGSIIVAVIVAILLLGYFALLGNARDAGAQNREVSGPASYAMFLEMMTVFLLTGTILILGLSGRLNTEALAALIGGISGYVLGRMHSSQQRPA
jgi:hypothetical protein